MKLTKDRLIQVFDEDNVSIGDVVEVTYLQQNKPDTRKFWVKVKHFIVGNDFKVTESYYPTYKNYAIVDEVQSHRVVLICPLSKDTDIRNCKSIIRREHREFVVSPDQLGELYEIRVVLRAKDLTSYTEKREI